MPVHLASTRTTRTTVRHPAFRLARTLHFFTTAAACFAFCFGLETSGFPFVLVIAAFLYIFLFSCLSFSQAFGDSCSDIVHDDGDGLGSVVIRRDGKIHLVWIAVRVDHTKRGDTQTFCFGERDVLMTDIHDEQGGGNTTQLCDTTQDLFFLVLFTGQGQPFFLGDAVKSAVSQHLFDALHLLYALADGIEVGEHATQPAFRYERHVDLAGAIGDDLFGLLLRADEHYLLSA